MSTVIWHAHKVMNYYTIVLQDMSKRNMSVVLAKPERDCPKYNNIMTTWEEGLGNEENPRKKVRNIEQVKYK